MRVRYYYLLHDACYWDGRWIHVPDREDLLDMPAWRNQSLLFMAEQLFKSLGCKEMRLDTPKGTFLLIRVDGNGSYRDPNDPFVR